MKEGLTRGSPVFLSSGWYADTPGKVITEATNKSDFSGRKAAIFGISMSGWGSEVKSWEKILAEQGADVPGECRCKGQSLLDNQHNPNVGDRHKPTEFTHRMKDA